MPEVNVFLPVRGDGGSKKTPHRTVILLILREICIMIRVLYFERATVPAQQRLDSKVKGMNMNGSKTR